MYGKDENNIHEKGYLTVKYGSIYPQKDFSFMIDNMAMIIDIEIGSVLKYGDIDHSDIKNYYENMCKKYHNLGLADMTDSIMLITFDRYQGILDIDEICSLSNYFLNHIGEKMREILNMTESELKELIKRIQEWGF